MTLSLWVSEQARRKTKFIDADYWLSHHWLRKKNSGNQCFRDSGLYNKGLKNTFSLELHWEKWDAEGNVGIFHRKEHAYVENSCGIAIGPRRVHLRTAIQLAFVFILKLSFYHRKISRKHQIQLIFDRFFVGNQENVSEETGTFQIHSRSTEIRCSHPMTELHDLPLFASRSDSISLPIPVVFYSVVRCSKHWF